MTTSHEDACRMGWQVLGLAVCACVCGCTFDASTLVAPRRDGAAGPRDLTSDMVGAHVDAGGPPLPSDLPDALAGALDQAGHESPVLDLVDAPAEDLSGLDASGDVSGDLLPSPDDGDATVGSRKVEDAATEAAFATVDAVDVGPDGPEPASDAGFSSDAGIQGDVGAQEAGAQDAALSQITFEASDLSRTASSIGAANTVETAGKCPDSPCKYVQFTAGATPSRGDWIEFTLPQLSAGVYSVTMDFKSAYNRGIVQASLDGTTFGASCDQYSADFVYYVHCSLGSVRVQSSGAHLLRLTVTGRNSASSGYVVTYERFIFVGANGS